MQSLKYGHHAAWQKHEIRLQSNMQMKKDTVSFVHTGLLYKNKKLTSVKV